VVRSVEDESNPKIPLSSADSALAVNAVLSQRGRAAEASCDEERAVGLDPNSECDEA